MKRTKLVYLLSKNEKELLAYDENDSEGSGEWFTDNPIMANEYNYEQAVSEGAEKEGLDVYMWEVTYDTDEKKIIKEEIWLQFTIDEAIKWKKRKGSSYHFHFYAVYLIKEEKMGWWYWMAFITGVILYIKFTFFSKQYNWHFAVSMQLTIIGMVLIVFFIFMCTPVSNRLIDLLFP